MAVGSQPGRSGKPSINYKRNLLNGAVFELADFDRESHAPNSSENKENHKNSGLEPSEIMSTSELISAVGSIWDSKARPILQILSRTSSGRNDSDHRKNNIFGYSTAEKICGASSSTLDQYIPVNLDSDADSSPVVLANVECLKANKKVSFFGPLFGNYPLWDLLKGESTMPPEACKVKHVACNLGSVYNWMREMSFLKFKQHLNCATIGSHETKKYTLEHMPSSPAGCCTIGDATDALNGFITGDADCQTDRTKPTVSLLGQIDKHQEFVEVSTSTSCLRHFNEVLHDEELDTLKISSSRNQSVSHEYSTTPTCSTCEENNINSKDNLRDYRINEKVELEGEFNSEVQICVEKEKHRYAFAKQEHAFAGAMAGTFVSLCLHPIDTIKTVVQSCRYDQKPFYYIGRSIISERGVTALYRGISTNLASSAPISAIYTFTYESVKGSLLPLFPKEYHSFAHCLAGGCASIATSFVFTPSDRIKQQMQVDSRYQNCWNALIGIIRSGGLPSLYAGWGAVLCRNIPHSIIKFYTYESLKELRLSSPQLKNQNDTLMTLVCGGLAGSTAALFTTPFDVVKTRFQTQIPGSRTQFGVFDTLIRIGKREGLKGLYRGLSPRLVMYMTHGALFFASYESFKRLFSLETSQPKAEAVTHKRNLEDDPATLPSPNQQRNTDQFKVAGLAASVPDEKTCKVD